MVKRSYIKIHGPPVLKALKVLEALSVDMPEVCIMDTMISQPSPEFDDEEGRLDYFNSALGQAGLFGRGGDPYPGEITVERCNEIISDSGESLGEYDFFFEWFKDPTMKQLHELIDSIDKALDPLECRYTITTK